jgi:hypothetical protein
MISDTINMDDMTNVYNVTDTFNIDRETISVELTKEDPGSVEFNDGRWEMTLPLTTPLEQWQATLKAEIARLGG